MDDEDDVSAKKSSPSMLSPLASPIQSPPSEYGRLRGRRRSSLVPPDTQMINLSPNRGSHSPRRQSQAFLMADDTIVMAFESGGRKTSRRMSSFCTTSSNEDTILTVEESMTEEEVLETLKAHKQIIANVKTQTWPMHRKLKVLRKAKLYIKKHEGELKQSKQAKDIISKYRSYMEKTVKKLKRELANLIAQLTPWEMRIKKIESQFGSVVASYFTFLRWVFWINTFISVFICVFLMVPEVLRGHEDPTGMRKEVSNQESALTLKSMWEFEGYLKFSPIFYGYYSSEETTEIGYRLPLAYLLATMILYLFSFFFILRKMTQTAKMSRSGAQEDEYVFSWKIFTGWDYLIGNSETAYNKVSSIVMGLREAILEDKERKKEEKTDWKLITIRILSNIFVLFLLCTSAYAVVLAVERDAVKGENDGWLRENELSLVMNGIGMVYQNLFNLVAIVEAYHPATEMKWMLARILVLNLLNVYTLMFSLFNRVDKMTAELEELKNNITIDKRLRMTWETEVTVTVMMERAERMQRSIADEDEGLEGRFYWIKGFPVREQTRTPAPTAAVPVTGHRPLVIKDEWTSNLNQHPDMDMLEGRRTIPSHPVRSTTSLPSTRPDPDLTPDPGGSDISDSSTESETVPTARTTVSGRTTSAGNRSALTTATRRPTTRRQTTEQAEQETQYFTTPTEFTTTTTYEADITTYSSTGMAEKRTCREEEPELPITDDDLLLLEEEKKEKLRTLCWETMFGQELTKMTVMDLATTAFGIIVGDFLRALIVRYMNGKACFFWDLEKFPGYTDFPIAENILGLVNNQGMVWLGMFFSPGLPAINTIKLCIMMYLRSWAVLTCNIPHETVFKASGNNFYYALLLLMLFICCLPVAYTCVWLKPSWHCGPFSEYQRVYHILTDYVESLLPPSLNKVVDFLTSPGSIIPLLLLLTLIIYYLVSRNSQLAEDNADLKSQLRKEKDTLNPEMSKSAMQPEGAVLPPEKKHVRIQEDVMTSSSDKALLLPNEEEEAASSSP